MHTSCSATRSLNEGNVCEVCGRWLKREREWQKPDEHTHTYTNLHKHAYMQLKESA